MNDDVKVIKDGKIVASSKNLEVIGRYNRKVSNIVKMEQNCRDLKVMYENGAEVNTDFADPSILEDYIRKKAKRFDFKFDIKQC